MHLCSMVAVIVTAMLFTFPTRAEEHPLRETVGAEAIFEIPHFRVRDTRLEGTWDTFCLSTTNAPLFRAVLDCVPVLSGQYRQDDVVHDFRVSIYLFELHREEYEKDLLDNIRYFLQWDAWRLSSAYGRSADEPVEPSLETLRIAGFTTHCGVFAGTWTMGNGVYRHSHEVCDVLVEATMFVTFDFQYAVSGDVHVPLNLRGCIETTLASLRTSGIRDLSC